MLLNYSVLNTNVLLNISDGPEYSSDDEDLM